jgi:beta-lactamase regulating signal transducer with metallopeptidase domain
MPEPFPGLLSDLVGWLLTYLLHSSALIAAAWLVTKVVRLRPAARDALWKMALLGGVVTAAAAVLSGGLDDHLMTLHERIGSAAGSPGNASQDFRGWISDEPVTLRREVRVRVVEPDAACGKALQASSPLESGWRAGVDEACSSGPWRQAVVLAALILWLCGAGLGIAHWVVRWRALNPVIRGLGPADVRSRRLLDSLGGGGTPRRSSSPRLRVGDVLVAPCVLPGAIIALPRRCELELSDAELGAVLAHEWAHVARRDVLWSSVLRVLVAVLWIQPLNRWALRQLLDAMEQSCDDWALRRTGERLGLARSISLVAEWSVASTAFDPAVSMGGTRSGAAERVERILAGGGPRPEPVWLRAGLIVMLLVPMHWVPSVPPPDSLLPKAIFVEERTVLAVVPPGDAGDPGAADSVARVKGEMRGIADRRRRD